MVSKLVTSRSIWRSVSLISALGAVRSRRRCGGSDVFTSSAAGHARAGDGPTLRVLLVGGDIRTMDPQQAARATAICDRRRPDHRRRRRRCDAASLGGADRSICRARRQDGHARADRRALPSLRARRRSREHLGARAADEAETRAGRRRCRETRRPTSGCTGAAGIRIAGPASSSRRRRALDAVVPDRPVRSRRVDGHAIWVNSKALEARQHHARRRRIPPAARSSATRRASRPACSSTTRCDLVDVVSAGRRRQVRERADPRCREARDRGRAHRRARDGHRRRRPRRVSRARRGERAAAARVRVLCAAIRHSSTSCATRRPAPRDGPVQSCAA